MSQVKNSFDVETKRKVGKGFLYGLATAITVGITGYCNTGDWKKAILIGIAGFTGSIINVPIEYSKGEIDVSDNSKNAG